MCVFLAKGDCHVHCHVDCHVIVMYLSCNCHVMVLGTFLASWRQLSALGHVVFLVKYAWHVDSHQVMTIRLGPMCIYSGLCGELHSTALFCQTCSVLCLHHSAHCCPVLPDLFNDSPLVCFTTITPTCRYCCGGGAPLALHGASQDNYKTTTRQLQDNSQDNPQDNSKHLTKSLFRPEHSNN